jgi:hypothetical protein
MMRNQWRLLGELNHVKINVDSNNKSLSFAYSYSDEVLLNLLNLVLPKEFISFHKLIEFLMEILDFDIKL